MKRPLLLAALLVPLLLSVAPSSPLAHDAGYYTLQARWIEQGGPWLAPLWFGAPVFDRSIGAQWLMALSLRLFGATPGAEALPALLAACSSLALTGWLARRLLPRTTAERRLLPLLAVAVLALTPLWLNYAHLATQDMLLLAVELAGISALVASTRQGTPWWPLVAGLAPGLAFLIKGFMVAVPLLAIAPYLLLERRWLLGRWRFWLGLGLGWLPVVLWLGLSIQNFGLPVVSGLWQKLLFLSQADVYAAGPFYYLWNVPANTAPWILAALAGWVLLWRRALDRQARLVLLLYPLLLVLLLSGFRTKTPYYGLQLTPWIAMASAVAIQHWGMVMTPWIRRVDRLIAVVGAVVLAAAAMAVWPGSPLQVLLAEADGVPPIPGLLLAAVGLGLCWLVIPAAGSPQRRLTALLLGPWLALVLLTQLGLFSDRSPGLRLALAPEPMQTQLRQGPIQAAALAPLSGHDHAQLILLSLATPDPPDQLLNPQAVPPGQRVWIRRSELGNPRAWRIAIDAPALEGWVLAEKQTPPSISTP
jgi:4-amino-4-deoxy-L-arabinose transferase-like glycosyltransferase